MTTEEIKSLLTKTSEKTTLNPEEEKVFNELFSDSAQEAMATEKKLLDNPGFNKWLDKARDGFMDFMGAIDSNIVTPSINTVKKIFTDKNTYSLEDLQNINSREFYQKMHTQTAGMPTDEIEKIWKAIKDTSIIEDIKQDIHSATRKGTFLNDFFVQYPKWIAKGGKN